MSDDNITGGTPESRARAAAEREQMRAAGMKPGHEWASDAIEIISRQPAEEDTPEFEWALGFLKENPPETLERLGYPELAYQAAEALLAWAKPYSDYLEANKIGPDGMTPMARKLRRSRLRSVEEPTDEG